jgi:hypothetical protein
MKVFKKIIIGALISISVSNATTLDTEQKNKILESYKIGSQIKCSNGMTIEYTLPSIMGQESSFGKNNVGDKYDKTGRLKSLYDSSLGNFQIKLSTAKRVIMRYKILRDKYSFMVNTDKSTYKLYEKHYKKVQYYLSVIESPVWKKRVERGEPKAISTIKWAKKEYIKHYELYKKYKEEAKKDTILINNLMYNFKFSAFISGYYFKMCYDEAYRKFGTEQAYWRAVGRYNGGWSNKTYYKKIIKRMKTVKIVIKNATI